MAVLTDVEIRSGTAADLEAFNHVLATAFGQEALPVWVERIRQLLGPDRVLTASADGQIVGTAGAFPFELTVPGGLVPAAGVTMVGVLPSHRRRGILTRLMERQLADIRSGREPVAILWASEAGIYHRFGYGMAAVAGDIDIERDRAVFRQPVDPVGRSRLITLEEAARVLPAVYDRVRRVRPGMLSRSAPWWTLHRLRDDKEERRGGGPLFCAVWEQAGGPQAYALYRIHSVWESHLPGGFLRVHEAVATSPLATREIWRFLFGIDLVKEIKAFNLPPDHPLFAMVSEPRRLRMTLADGLWLRIVDLAAALRARTYGGDGSLVLEVTDAMCPDNAGGWRLQTRGGAGRVERTTAPADLTLDIQDLGALYLGGTSVGQLQWAGRIHEGTAGAGRRADLLFPGEAAPWCPEVF